MRCAAAGIPTSSSHLIARARASRSDSFICVCMVSTSWRPMEYSGFKVVSGSWKIAPICLPRSGRICSWVLVSIRSPFSRICPPATLPGGSSRPMIAAPVSDLPAPLSPTTPSTSPGSIASDTPSSARSTPRRVGNSTTRSTTSSNAISATSGSERRAASRPAS